ncbi:MAG: twin-arginine translocation signal domain-containing protein [Verrucomicrobiota bacterium]
MSHTPGSSFSRRGFLSGAAVAAAAAPGLLGADTPATATPRKVRPPGGQEPQDSGDHGLTLAPETSSASLDGCAA